MIHRPLALLALLMALAACSGNSLNNDPDTGTEEPEPEPDGSVNGVPAAVANNLRAITYSPEDGGTLRVNMDGLVGSAREVAFLREPTLDVNGYQAFTYQETGLQRTHLALVNTNARENLRVTSVGDGGQFNRQFGGNTYARIDRWSRPDTGQFSYAGSYAGVFVSGGTTNDTLPPDFAPGTPLRVTGEALITASFSKDRVEGGISNRQIIDANGDTVLALQGITFPAMAIDSDGRFLGEVEFSDAPGSVIGDVGGLFGGQGATDVAGAIVINPIEGDDGLWEYGGFNLPRCDLAGASPLCVPR